MRQLTRNLLLASLLMTCAQLGLAQDRARTVDASHSSSATVSAAALDPAYIPHGSKVYVHQIQGMNGFENYLVAAFKKKKVDLMVVADRSQADFEITGFAEHKRAGWAKIIFGSGLPESEASIQVVNVKTSVVAYAVGSYRRWSVMTSGFTNRRGRLNKGVIPSRENRNEQLQKPCACCRRNPLPSGFACPSDCGSRQYESADGGCVYSPFQSGQNIYVH
jgi:3D (Asp-Asp-Asp) domain-containing protein